MRQTHKQIKHTHLTHHIHTRSQSPQSEGYVIRLGGKENITIISKTNYFEFLNEYSGLSGIVGRLSY